MRTLLHPILIEAIVSPTPGPGMVKVSQRQDCGTKGFIMMGWYGSGGGAGWGIGSWLATGFGMVVFWGLVILAVVALLRTAPRKSVTSSRHPSMRPGPGSYSAIEYLDDRFARGEITEQEYVHIRDTLLGR